MLQTNGRPDPGGDVSRGRQQRRETRDLGDDADVAAGHRGYR